MGYGCTVVFSAPGGAGSDYLQGTGVDIQRPLPEGTPRLPWWHGAAQTLSGAAAPLFGRHRPGPGECRTHQRDDRPSARSPLLAGRTRRQAEETQQHPRLPRTADRCGRRRDPPESGDQLQGAFQCLSDGTGTLLRQERLVQRPVRSAHIRAGRACRDESPRPLSAPQRPRSIRCLHRTHHRQT